MIESIWFQNHWLGKLAYPILRPLSALFGIIARRRRQQFLSGDKPSYRPNVPVVVVGNISVGGNGKTPIVVFLVEALQSLGYRPGVVSRGYGGKADYPLTLDNKTTAAQSGDEPLLIYRRTGAPVVVDPNRSQAVKTLETMNVDVVITDDGLQHYRLARDVEIVVIDGMRRFGNQHYMPYGPLRESTDRLQAVDLLLNNGGTPQANEIGFSLAAGDAVNLASGETCPVSELTQLVAMAGIGHPPRFFNTLKALGATLEAEHGFADHQAFDIQAIQQLTQANQHLIMTEKDAVKLDGQAQSNWWYLPVSAQFDGKGETQIIQKITEVIEHYGSSST